MQRKHKAIVEKNVAWDGEVPLCSEGGALFAVQHFHVISICSYLECLAECSHVFNIVLLRAPRCHSYAYLVFKL